MIELYKIVKFKASRSSGAGGQNVNKRSTKVHMWVEVSRLPISEEEKKKVRERLDRHINKEDELWVECEEERLQELNRERALERLGEMIEGALRDPVERVPIVSSMGADEARLREKVLHKMKKLQRRHKIGGEEESFDL